MKRFLFLLLLFPLMVFAQFSDSFDDGNLTRNPAWTGTRNLFVINRLHQLQLNDTTAGKAWLATASRLLPQTEWHLWVKAAFSPSSKNFIRIFLAADTSQIPAIKKGYYLQLGEAGTDDAIALYRKTENQPVLVCRGRVGEVAKPFALRLKIFRSSSGKWQVWVDGSGGENYTLEAEGTDATYQQLKFFGLYCQYTKSNAKKMFFDDLYAGPPVRDTLPPVADSLKVHSGNRLQLFFSERLDSVSATDKGHYQLNPPAGKLSEIRLSEEKNSVLLTFSKPFQNNTDYSLTLSGIKDLAGNLMTPQKLQFAYVNPEPFDVVFNEIMADPVPAVGLPACEYLELYNRNTAAIDLYGWKLVLGKSVKTFGKISVPAHGYLILCKNESIPELSPFGKTYGFSSFSLTNSGELLQLVDSKGVLIDQVQYGKSWYRDAGKENGGWSLEQKNPDNVCSGSENWAASTDKNGGTPGKQNSVYTPEVFYPELVDIQVPDAHSVKLAFSQQMDSLSLANPSFYEVSPGNFTLSGAAVAAGNTGVTLRFSPDFDTAAVYHLTVAGGITNCSGKSLKNDTTLRFGLPQEASENDVIINEVLFYPLSGGSDYVELYNRSHKIIDLSKLILGTVKTAPPNPPDSLFYNLGFEQKMFFPGDYVVLTASPEKVKAQYHTKNPRAFLRVAPFPKLNKESGSVLLFRGLQKIDAFDYSEKMQYPLLQYTQGVALERVNPDGKTNDWENWHSAAENVGFGTPGYKNSQTISVNPDTLPGEVWIEPEIFSPDNDGYQDLLPVYYKFKTAGNTISIKIYDASGHPVRQLVNNRYVGSHGEFTWNGLQDDGTRAPAGIYILYVQVFDEQGHVKNFKKTAVLATRK